MPRKNLCSVPQCEYVSGTVRHKFLVYEEREFKIWVQRINNPLLKVFDVKIYKNFMVCDKHFHDNSRSLGTKRLTRLSLPTLYLSGFSDSLTVLGLESGPSNESLPAQEELTNQDTSQKTTLTDKVEHYTPPDTPNGNVQFFTPEKAKRCLEFQSFHRRSLILRTRTTPGGNTRGLLGGVNVHRVSQLTPKAHHIYNVATQLKKKTCPIV